MLLDDMVCMELFYLIRVDIYFLLIMNLSISILDTDVG